MDINQDTVIANCEYSGDDYLNKIVIPNFMNLVNEKIYSTIYNRNLEIVATTNYSASSVGLSSWQESIGKSYKDHANSEILRLYFKDAYNPKTAAAIHRHARWIFEIQKLVINTGRVASFMDLLPYNNVFKSYLTTLIPLYDPKRVIVGLQGFAVECRFFSFQEHLKLYNNEFPSKIYTTHQQLTPREQEILFLLANGITQEQIAQILHISRSTVATIISNQLCVKFGIPGSNTKLLSQSAIQNGYYQYIPPSLWQPNVIILEEDIAKLIEKRLASE